MSQFCGSFALLSSRSGVTSAATAGSAMAARPIEVNAASISLLDTAFLPLVSEANSSAADDRLGPAPPSRGRSFGGDRLPHLIARFWHALWKIEPPPRAGAPGAAALAPALAHLYKPRHLTRGPWPKGRPVARSDPQGRGS